jgi:hypothetical protein
MVANQADPTKQKHNTQKVLDYIAHTEPVKWDNMVAEAFQHNIVDDSIASMITNREGLHVLFFEAFAPYFAGFLIQLSDRERCEQLDRLRPDKGVQLACPFLTSNLGVAVPILFG